jgi:hypothetical protein
MGARGSRNGREPAPPAEGGNRLPARPSGAVATAGPDRPVTSPAASIQEAEAPHTALADARSRTARLIAGLRRHRKQSRLLGDTLRSLRELKLAEAVE